VSINAQVKFEREYRIDKNDVPVPANQFIDAIDFKKKVKWYKEEGLQTHTYEAKTKFSGRKYSIEFDSIGHLEDIEYEIKWKEISEESKAKINSYLKENYQKSKICKVQIQLSGDPDRLLKLITTQANDQNITVNYEIVIKGKRDRSFDLFEYLFAYNGELIKRSKIILKNTDNLEY
jgi:hypothetical protein